MNRSKNVVYLTAALAGCRRTIRGASRAGKERSRRCPPCEILPVFLGRDGLRALLSRSAVRSLSFFSSLLMFSACVGLGGTGQDKVTLRPNVDLSAMAVCDAQTPCAGGEECIVFHLESGSEARCVDPNIACDLIDCGHDHCALAESYPAQLFCSGHCVSNCDQPVTSDPITNKACPCAVTEFCDPSATATCVDATTNGTCLPRPEVCTTNYDPVCGCDGQTYSNLCDAQSAGVGYVTHGACGT